VIDLEVGMALHESGFYTIWFFSVFSAYLCDLCVKYFLLL